MTALAVGALMLTACNGDATPSVDPTGPEIGFETSPTPSEPATEDEWAAPDPLTEEYVRRVLTEIEREQAGFFGWFLTGEHGSEVPEEIKDHIRRSYIAVSAEAFIDQVIAAYQEPEDFDHLADPYGQYTPSEVVILRADAACPLLEVDWDASAAEVAPGAEGGRQKTLIALGQQVAGAPSNRTGWVYEAAIEFDDLAEGAIQQELESRSLCG